MKRISLLLAALCLPLFLFAQGPKNEEEAEKALYEAIDKEIEHYTSLLDLEDWQIFRIDSTLVHDYKALSADVAALRTAKVSNTSAYQSAQDKWYEAIYQSFMQILTPEQQTKYLKSGAARATKGRDKRAAETPDKKKKK